MTAASYVPPATTVSGWCNEKHCEACFWPDCEHDCHGEATP